VPIRRSGRTSWPHDTSMRPPGSPWIASVGLDPLKRHALAVEPRRP
jgi:hypothetical protein